ncbi:hypothetical protein EAO21_27030 [Klebsiella pneumoniae]|nr:hypothetical protein EAO21_27030 [Klebsiella pneumoniae]
MHPTVRYFLKAQRIIPLTATVIDHLWPTFSAIRLPFLIAFSSVKLAPGYTNSCSLILPG